MTADARPRRLVRVWRTVTYSTVQLRRLPGRTAAWPAASRASATLRRQLPFGQAGSLNSAISACESSFVTPSSRSTSPASRASGPRPRSSTPARSGSPTSCPRPTFSAATPKCPSRGTKRSQRGRLQWIQSSAAGLDHCLVPSVVASDITVTSASGVLAKQVADQTLALLAGRAAKSADVFSRPAEARVHPPPDARPARRPHRHRRPGRQRPPPGRGAQGVRNDDRRHRLVSRAEVAVRRRAAAGRRRRRTPAARRRPDPRRAAHRPHPRHDRRPPAAAAAARRRC